MFWNKFSENRSKTKFFFKFMKIVRFRLYYSNHMFKNIEQIVLKLQKLFILLLKIASLHYLSHLLRFSNLVLV